MKDELNHLRDIAAELKIISKILGPDWLDVGKETLINISRTIEILADRIENKTK